MRLLWIDANVSWCLSFTSFSVKTHFYKSDVTINEGCLSDDLLLKSSDGEMTPLK